MKLSVLPTEWDLYINIWGGLSNGHSDDNRIMGMDGRLVRG